MNIYQALKPIFENDLAIQSFHFAWPDYISNGIDSTRVFVGINEEFSIHHPIIKQFKEICKVYRVEICKKFADNPEIEFLIRRSEVIKMTKDSLLV